ncbi:MAG: Gfo/Idh/MocA family oxidoreductase [Planctomycetaceae bacterium]|nr:Gfo/Idh/MocA family oxidoreductase [Planctomycetaceae bacterium]
MKPEYRVAVIGCTGRGNYGHGLDTAWLYVPQTRIVAVADEQEPGRLAAAKRLKCEAAFADYRRMLDEVQPDIVAICPRWIDQHTDMLLAAAERGIHCYIEKPFCRTLQEADQIIQAAEMTHTRISIAHPTRFSPVTERVRTLISEGAIGQVLELRGRGKEDARGGGEDLWVLGSHVMDMILALGFAPQWCFADVLQTGHRVTAADVSAGNEGIGPLAGDAIRATYGLQQGMTATFQSYRNAGRRPSRYGLQIFGSQGIIELLEGTLAEAWILADPSWNPARGGGQWKRISSAGIDLPEPLTDERHRNRNILAIEDLLDAIENHREPRCNMYEGRRIVEMIAAVFESHRRNSPVSLPLEVRENPLSVLVNEESRQRSF